MCILDANIWGYSWFPPGMENLEKWKTIFQSGNFDQTGKVGEFHLKYWKNQEILTLENGNKYWKSQENFAVRKVKTVEIVCYTLNKKLNKKHTGKMEKKILESQGNFSKNVGTMLIVMYQVNWNRHHYPSPRSI